MRILGPTLEIMSLLIHGPCTGSVQHHKRPFEERLNERARRSETSKIKVNVVETDLFCSKTDVLDIRSDLPFGRESNLALGQTVQPLDVTDSNPRSSRRIL